MYMHGMLCKILHTYRVTHITMYKFKNDRNSVEKNTYTCCIASQIIINDRLSFLFTNTIKISILHTKPLNQNLKKKIF